jgi:hypothetical protein
VILKWVRVIEVCLILKLERDIEVGLAGRVLDLSDAGIGLTS